MQYELQQLFIHGGFSPALSYLSTIVLLLVAFSIIAFITVKLSTFFIHRYLNPIIHRRMPKNVSDFLKQKRLLRKGTGFIPAFIFFFGSDALVFPDSNWTLQISHFVTALSLLYLLVLITRLLFIALDAGNLWYEHFPVSHKQPIRGYIQVIKIIFIGFIFILAGSIILDKSPWALLTGLGALSAIFLLVFKDTISGFVANIQVSAYDMVRIGDWITLPSYHVDGDVMDISINTVKIRNFDRTIVTIPTNALISSGVQNWRGMSESGGRRIKRAIHIDINSITYCHENLLNELSQIALLSPVITEKQKHIDSYNRQHNIHNTDNPINGRQQTNIGLFRYYIEKYLRSLSTINFELTFLVRQLAPSETGLPIEIYVFTNDTNWIRYEAIQADIFDHLLAAIPYFKLKVFQLENRAIQ